MTTRITIRDWEALSAYLDNQLKPKDRVRLESRLEQSPELRSALEELRRTRAVLRSQRRLRAPRNFTLTPEMAGVRLGFRPGARPISSSYPVLRLASVLATIFFIFITIGDLAVRMAAPAPMTVAVSQDQPVMAPFGMGGGGGGAEVPPAPAAVEEPVMEAPAPAEEALQAAPAPTQALLAEGEAFSAMASAVPDEKAVVVTPLSLVGTPSLSGTPSLPGTPTPAEAAKLLAPEAAEPQDAAQAMENVAPAEPAERQTTPTSQLTWQPLLRIIQVLLAVLAIGAGLAALYLRRSAQS
jgi:hypothetical protein